MNAGDLESYLHRHIPLSAALEVRVREATRERVILDAPLAPNRNHREGAFGGSIASVGMLAGWSLVHLAFRPVDPAAHIVIRSSRIRFIGPIAADFSATCEPAGEDQWERFYDSYRRKGVARIAMTSILAETADSDRRAAVFEGEFVAAGARFQRLRFE